MPMAREGEEQEMQVVNKWIIDYLCKITWEDFKQTCQIPDAKRDLIQGMLSLVDNGSGVGQDRQLFLVLLCRLSDGEECETQYSEDSSITVLEDTLMRFRGFVNLQDKDLREDGLALLDVIKAEAVLVCLRVDEFDIAKEVCDRLWPKKDRNNKKDKIPGNIQAILKNGKTDDSYLEKYKYKDFLKTMINYLDKVQRKFEKPLLIRAARNYLNGSGIDKVNGNLGVNDLLNESNNAENITPRRNTVTEFPRASTEKAREREGRVATPEKHIKKLWDNTTTEIFGGSTTCESRKQGSTETPKNRKRILPDSQTPKSKTSMSSKQRKLTPNVERDHQEPGPSNMNSPAKYRKNINRENRHEPTESTSSSELSDVDEDDTDIGSTSLTKKRGKWTEDEMSDFYDAVVSFGVGKWAEIKDFLGTSRTGVQLKDKYRNMLKSGDLANLEKRRKKKK